jgi:hypothetical protein
MNASRPTESHQSVSGARVTEWAALSAILFGASLRAVVWACKHFWWDSYALLQSVVGKTFFQLLSAPLDRGQSAPAGFTLFMKLWGTVFGFSEAVLTFPLLVAGVSTLFVLDRCLREMNVRLARIPALLLFALHPGLVFYSAEFKPYGLDVLASSLFVLALLLAPKRFGRGRLALLVVLAPFFSTPAIFQIPVLFAFLFAGLAFSEDGSAGLRILRAFRTLRVPGVLAGIGVGLAALHLFSTMPGSHMLSYWTREAAFPPALFSSGCTGWYLDKLTLFFRGPVYFSPIPSEGGCLRLAAVSVPIALLAVGCFSGPAKGGRKTLAFALALLAAVLLASVLRKWPVLTGDFFMSRLLLFLAPAFVLVLACGVEGIWSRSVPAGAVIALLAVLSTLAPLVRWLSTDRWYEFSYDGGKGAHAVAEKWTPGRQVWVDARAGSPFGALEPAFLRDAEQDIRWFRFWLESPSPWPVPSKGTVALFDIADDYAADALSKTKSKAAEAGLGWTETTNRPMVLVEFR